MSKKLKVDFNTQLESTKSNLVENDFIFTNIALPCENRSFSNFYSQSTCNFVIPTNLKCCASIKRFHIIKWNKFSTTKEFPQQPKQQNEKKQVHFHLNGDGSQYEWILDEECKFYASDNDNIVATFDHANNHFTKETENFIKCFVPAILPSFMEMVYKNTCTSKNDHDKDWCLTSNEQIRLINAIKHGTVESLDVSALSSFSSQVFSKPIKISCISPQHRDTNPSAIFNTNYTIWCFKCIKLFKPRQVYNHFC
jgi:hypothetical protein